MKTIVLFIKFLMTFKDFVEFMDKKITDEEYLNRTKKMQEAARRASEGDLDDRLGGGRDVEDQLNDRVDDSH